LAPVLVVLVVSGGKLAAYVAAVVFVVGAATDRLDGYLARRFASATRTGAWLDPLADKLFVLAPVVALTAVGRFPLWATLVFVVREVSVSILRAWLGTHGRSMPATPLGQWKTALQMLAILLYLLPLSTALDSIKVGVLVAAVALTIWSGLDYLVRVRT
jgi:CDP-diacylglycerol---glycerol-3-phosphate 3-phosphatidyltransferase